ncbi:Oxygen-insensitive NAD(P)H nitroreductase / Dihydropteridine reductase [hydrothermal vent metagenome]|uniref:Oxygen-insensitive NAD(P)H nitroreductase / Dihydropteridine reductase n=1 Tax=hydrothermal vent metagenome TaxID=652676 RepID=A0A3B0SE81_9ZZZZ
MKTTDAIKSRRAIKAFDPDHVMPKADEDELLSLAMLAPTAYNIQNWRFVVVKGEKLRGQVREAAWDQAQVTDSSMLIVVCADLKSWEKEPKRYWANAASDVQDFMLPMIDGYYRDKEQVQRDEAMRSCGIAAQTLMLAAKGMGYDSCPMDGFDFDKVGQLINLPDDHVIAMFVTIGKGVKEAWPRAGQLPMSDVVINDQF